MTATEEIKKIVTAFDFYEHPQKPNLFRKNHTVDIKDGSSESIDVTLFADFRKTDTGQFYSDPPVSHESIPLIQEIKDSIAKLPENRNSEDSGPPETPVEAETDTSVATAPQTPAVPERQKKEIKVKGLDMPIPALGMTMREMGLHLDIDYFLSTDGSQLTLQKEGITKLAAFASRLPDNPIIISDDYEEVEFDRDENGQITKIRLKGTAWIGSRDNPERVITDEIDWDWSSAVTRAIVKNVKNGMRLAKDAEHKKFGLPHKDKIALAEALTPGEVEYNPSGMLVPKDGVPVTKILPLMSYLADVREFALRTCIGKLRARMWSELLGIRSISAKEARVMRDETDNVNEERA